MIDNKQKSIIHYHQWLDEKINHIKQSESVPKLLLHSCCAPCSSYVLEYLSQYFSITVFFFNPNIHPEKEYKKRLNEQIRLIKQLPVKNKLQFIEGKYEPNIFLKEIHGLENEPENGKRCLKCYTLRLEEAAKKAYELSIPYFTTTLTVSPLKNAKLINEIGHDIVKNDKMIFLYSNFKKKNGFKRSIVLSEQYHLYRQNYCGCIFSMENKK